MKKPGASADAAPHVDHQSPPCNVSKGSPFPGSGWEARLRSRRGRRIRRRKEPVAPFRTASHITTDKAPSAGSRIRPPGHPRDRRGRPCSPPRARRGRRAFAPDGASVRHRRRPGQGGRSAVCSRSAVTSTESECGERREYEEGIAKDENPLAHEQEAQVSSDPVAAVTDRAAGRPIQRRTTTPRSDHEGKGQADDLAGPGKLGGSLAQGIREKHDGSPPYRPAGAS